MKKVILFLLMLTVTITAQTNVSGDGGGNWGTWAAANSPYYIVGNIIVNSGDTLTIEPGVEVDFTDTLYIRVYGTLLAQGTITDSIIFKHLNSGSKHFGIDIDQESLPQTISKFEYCRIQDGTAADDTSGISPSVGYPYIRFGGGIFIAKSSPVIQHCLIQNNEAFYGGGISSRYNCAPLIKDNIIRNNTALGQGAGIACYGSAGSEINQTIIKNNIIYNNSVNDPGHAYNFGGGGVSLFRQTDVIMANNVIANNYSAGKGGGIVLIPDQNTGVESTNVTITNTILWGNSQAREGGGLNQINITNTSSTYSISIDYSDIQGGYSGTANIDSDPVFVDSTHGNFKLDYGSPCIDAGTATNSPSADFDENPTNQDGNGDLSSAYDMGAFEFLSDIVSFSTSGTNNFSSNTFETGLSNQIAEITVNGVTSGGTVEVIPMTKSMPVNAPIGSKAIQRWYRVVEDPSLAYSTANIELFYDQSEFAISGLLSESNLSLWKYENGAWINKAGLWTDSPSGGSVVVSGNNSLDGYWAFADVNDASLPVAMGKVKASYNGELVELDWNTESEINNAGFEILKRTGGEGQYHMIGTYQTDNAMKGLGTSNIGQVYQFIDKNVRESDVVNYELMSVDLNGERELVATLSVICENVSLADNFVISSNYPNPFNPETKFDIDVSSPRTIGFYVYNIQGQLVEKRMISINSSGIRRIVFSGNNIPSGLYFYTFTDINRNSTLKTGKMLLVK